MNSPLKSPISDSKSLSTLKKIIPVGSVIHSFLLYDGNIESHLAGDKRFVVAHTNKYVNYEFWECLQHDANRLSEIVKHFCPIESENIFDVLQKEWPKYHDPFIRSAMFYLLNHSSDLGYVSSGKLLDNVNFSRKLIKLKSYQNENLHVEFDKDDNFINSINKIQNRCDYVFLPVRNFSFNFLEDGKNLGFEQTRVIHKDLKKFIDNTDKKVIILYNYSKQALNLYKDYNIKIIDKWGRNTEATKFAEEVLIANF